MTIPYFSIIIPTKDRLSLLMRAIKSVIEQDLGDWELIVINDGSTDNTHQYMNQLVDSRIKYQHQNNQGRSAARNNGLSIARGKYICFLDDDDLYLYNHLSIAKKAIESNMEVCILKTGAILQKENSRLDEPFMSSLNINSIEYCWLYGISLFQLIVPREVIKSNFDQNISFGEDLYWVLLHLLDGVKMVEVEERTVVINDHSQRSSYDFSKDNTMKMYDDLIFVRDSLKTKGIEKHVSTSSMLKAYTKTKKILLRNLLKGGYIWTFVKYCWK